MNKTAIIIGSLAILGIGAYFYLKPKAKAEDTIGLGTTGSGTTGSGTTGVGSTTQPPTQPEVKTTSAEDLIEIIKLKDYITERANAMNNYKKQSSRNAVKEDIRQNMEKLQLYGYTLDNKRQLIKIAI
jgi:hypothetical protein